MCWRLRVSKLRTNGRCYRFIELCLCFAFFRRITIKSDDKFDKIISTWLVWVAVRSYSLACHFIPLFLSAFPLPTCCTASLSICHCVLTYSSTNQFMYIKTHTCQYIFFYLIHPYQRYWNASTCKPRLVIVPLTQWDDWQSSKPGVYRIQNGKSLATLFIWGTINTAQSRYLQNY